MKDREKKTKNVYFISSGNSLHSTLKYQDDNVENLCKATLDDVSFQQM